MQADPNLRSPALIDDSLVIRRVKEGEVALFEIVIRRYNQRLYRIIRSILGSDSDVEDVLQDVYLSAYRHLDQFEGRSSFATWVTKIAVHEAMSRSRKGRRFRPLPDPADEDGDGILEFRSSLPDPEEDASRQEVMRLVEEAVDQLPPPFREVFVMREIEQMSQAETAECLGIREETVKTRLHRARGGIEQFLLARAGQGIRTAYAFGHARCAGIATRVLTILQEGLPPA